MKNEYPNLEETIQAYVLGNLLEGEKSEFEEYFLTKPEIIDQIKVAQNISVLADLEDDLTMQTTQANVPKSEKGFTLKMLSGWFTIPIPAYVALGVVALITPMIANQFAEQRVDQIELVAFSSSATRGESKNNLHEFDVIIDLSNLKGNSAIMLKVTPDVKQSYLLEVYDASVAYSGPVWTSSPITIKSGTRDQIVMLPKFARFQNAKIRVLGKKHDGSYSAVRFCHYSEVCL